MWSREPVQQRQFPRGEWTSSLRNVWNRFGCGQRKAHSKVFGFYGDGVRDMFVSVNDSASGTLSPVRNLRQQRPLRHHLHHICVGGVCPHVLHADSVLNLANEQVSSQSLSFEGNYIWYDRCLRSSKERLRGYFRFSNRKLRQSCETVITAAGTPAAPRAKSSRGESIVQQADDGHSDICFPQDYNSSWWYKARN